MASKADQKNEARARREAQQAAAAAAAKRNRNLQVLGGVIFSAILVVVLVVLLSGGSSDKGPAAYAEDPTPANLQGAAETRSLLQGIPQNGFALGEPKAPVTIYEFVDVQCPFCKEHQLDEQPTIIKELVRTGKAKLRLMPIALPQMGEDSEAGRTVAARLADEDKAWNFINLFYWNQGDEGTGYVTNPYLNGLVTAAGGKAADADRNADEATTAKLKEVDDLQEALAVSGTPSFALGRTGEEPSKAQLLTLNGQGSTADQVIDAADELAKRTGATSGT